MVADLSTPTNAPVQEIHVVTPGGDRWVVDLPPIRHLRRMLGLQGALVRWLHGCEEQPTLPASAHAIRSELLNAGIEPLDCAVTLVKQAEPSENAPNGWLTILLTEAVGAGPYYRADAGHGARGPRGLAAFNERR